MTRTVSQDQAAMGRNERIPDPPFEPSCPEVLDRFKLLYTTMPERLWHLQALRSLALQVAECEVTIHKMQMQARGEPFIDWEGKPNPIHTMLTKQQVVLGNLYVKLRALPEQADVDGNARTTAEELRKNQAFEVVGNSPVAGLNLIAKQA